MVFQPKVLGKYEGDDIILFKDDELGYCIKHNNKTHVLPYWCLSKDTKLNDARKVIENFTEKNT
jgi:hypothetical protein